MVACCRRKKASHFSRDCYRRLSFRCAAHVAVLADDNACSRREGLTNCFSSLLFRRNHNALGPPVRNFECKMTTPDQLQTTERTEGTRAYLIWTLRIRRKIRYWLIALYEWRLGRQLLAHDRPSHVGIILDGNRRYAKRLHDWKTPTWTCRLGLQSKLKPFNYLDD